MGSVFEEMCRYFTLEQGVGGKFDSFITETGTWWGTENFLSENGKRIQQSADIDVVAISGIDKSLLIGECKFKNEKMNKNVDVYKRQMQEWPAVRILSFCRRYPMI